MTEDKKNGISHPVEEVVSEDKSSGTYYTVKLPPGIKELELQVGDVVHLESTTDEDDLNYLLGRKAENPGSHIDGYYKVRGPSESPRLTLPTRFLDDLIEEPVYQMVVEVNTVATPHFRIYNSEEYFEKRRPRLIRQGYKPGQGEPIFFGLSIFEAIKKKTAETKSSRTPEEVEELREGFGDDIDDNTQHTRQT